jgi:translation initiation factor 2B subunit (eIF-2B alpha/beta/delta family)
MAIPEEYETRIEEIRRDRASGAIILAVRAATLLIECAQSAPECVPQVARGLMAAQPAMAPMFNLTHRVLAASDVPAACSDFLESMERGAALVAVNAAALVEDGMTVMTHSFSSTILEGLREAARSGKRFSAICPESRPVCEGVALAASLGMNGISSSVITDAAIYRFLPSVQLVWVGADAVSPRGVVNKTGTSLLALAAREFGVPVYVLCGSDKFLPGSHEAPPEEPRDPGEIVARDLPLVTAHNYYFDLTPLAYITGIVTESGILKPAELLEKLHGAPAW